jgi:hypothetical protein
MPQSKRTTPAATVYTVRTITEKPAEIVPDIAIRAERGKKNARITVELTLRGLADDPQERVSLFAYSAREGRGDLMLEAFNVPLAQVSALIDALDDVRAQLPAAFARRQAMARPVAAFLKVYEEAHA